MLDVLNMVMNNNPLVSIIIPVYNREHLITATLDSVLGQTYHNWECILVDDGSNDNSIEIVNTYCKKDSRFIFFQRPSNRNKGGNAARNYGFEVCSGEFVNWVDSDDILSPNFISKKISSIANFDCVISKFQLFKNTTDNIVSVENRAKITPSLLDDFVTLKVSWYTFDPMWKKTFLENKDLFDETLLKGQDRDFHIRILMLNPNIKIIDDYLYFYRINPVSISNLVSEKVAVSMLKSGLNRAKLLKNYGVKDNTQMFLFKQLLSLYPIVRNSDEAKRIYPIVLKSLFKLNFKGVKYTFKFFLTKFSFFCFGKGEIFLK